MSIIITENHYSISPHNSCEFCGATDVPTIATDVLGFYCQGCITHAQEVMSIAREELETYVKKNPTED